MLVVLGKIPKFMRSWLTAIAINGDGNGAKLYKNELLCRKYIIIFSIYIKSGNETYFISNYCNYFLWITISIFVVVIPSKRLLSESQQ